MPDPTTEAAALIRGLKDRVAQLEETVSSAEGIPNLVRPVEDEASVTDTATVTEDAATSTTWGTDNWGANNWQ